MNFKLFFEARQEFVDQIQGAIDKVSDRPFNDLFQGKGDRFLVKVFNPKFQKAADALDLPLNNFDFQNRKYSGVNINTAIKQKMQELMNNHKNLDLNEIKQSLINNFIKYKIDAYKENPLTRITEILLAYKVYFTHGTHNSYHLYSSDKSFIMELKDNDYLRENYKLNETLDEATIKKLLNDIIHLRVEFSYGGFLDSLNQLAEGVVASIQIPFNKKKMQIMEPINHLRALKQAIDQNNMFYYLLFSRHPIDVLRMSDHKGISSCHRLGGGKYSSTEGDYAKCALADAKNDGGIVYLIKGSDGRKVQNNLNDKDVFHDADRNEGNIQPIGRIRLRRFIDIETGKDFAVPTTLQDEQKYGYITPDIYQNILEYLRKHQPIFQNPPDSSYAKNNIVLVGGDYSDESLSYLLNNFFGKDLYQDIRHKTNHVISWQDEVNNIVNQYQSRLEPMFEIHAQPVANHRGNPYIFVRIFTKINIPYQQTWGSNRFSENLDRVLEAFNSQKRMLSFMFKEPTLETLNKRYQECTWNKGVLDVEVSFTMSDPQDMYLVIGNLLDFKKNITIKQKKIFKEIDNWMLSLNEE